MDKIKYSEEEENKKIDVKKLMSIITKLKNIIKC